MLNIVSRWLLVLGLLVPGAVVAHDARPLYLQINELESAATGSFRYTVKLKVPPSVEADNHPFVLIPDLCQQERLGLISQLNCSQSLKGQQIGIDYPEFNPAITALIRVNFSSGSQYQTLLAPNERHWQIPTEGTASEVAAEYTRMGIEHILIGWDHLLFLVCLLIIAGTFKRTLITISGFTLSHSLTLVLTTLGVIQIPIAPVEAVIALSIVFLAAEILRGRQNTLAWRYPVAVSTLFGLIHGCGFAAVLQEIGLPQNELTTALLFFNIGVEIGQVIFVLAVATQLTLLRQWRSLPLARLQQVLLYMTGSVAAFWTLERIAGF